MATYKESIRKRHLSERDATVCKICGRRFKLLGRHVTSTHNMSVDEYKLKYDLPLSVGLCSQELFDVASNRQKEHCKHPGWRESLSLAKRKSTIGIPQRSKLLKVALQRMMSNADERWNNRRDEFTAMWASRKPIAEMAQAFNCARKTIRDRRRWFGLPERVISPSADSM